MAEIIDFAEIQAARLQQRQRREHESLEQAVELVRMNLTAVANQLESASNAERVELLDRIDKLSAVMRYGIRLLGNAPSAPFDDVGRAG
ncbi:MAG TPA: hypothetical protein VMB26_05845 [Candidatus Binataceae bacterium]|nr:hypothetical protein [Candidatus Binataceae bacterium]